MPTLEGSLDGKNLKLGIVVSRFNGQITSRLLEGAVLSLSKMGVTQENVTVAWCPGAFEIPVVARPMADSKKWDALIALGCVIKGATYHFEHICLSASRGITEVSQKTGIPISFGLIFADTVNDAMERAGGRLGNRGEEAARAAVEMANLMRRVHGQ